jgi:putative flippase GtrA
VVSPQVLFVLLTYPVHRHANDKMMSFSKHIETLFRYAVAGILAITGHLAVLLSLVEVCGTNPTIAAAVSFTVAFGLNFSLARYFVFRSDRDAVMDQLLRFGLVNFSMRGVEYILFVLLFRVVPLHYFVCFFLSLGISNAAKFVIYKALVFRTGSLAES